MNKEAPKDEHHLSGILLKLHMLNQFLVLIPTQFWYGEDEAAGGGLRRLSEESLPSYEDFQPVETQEQVKMVESFLSRRAMHYRVLYGRHVHLFLILTVNRGSFSG
ncbi:hypothetical protein SUGI_0113280 [Cryptomeria japonica]|nr:hypothetical protein SUGI_0113280 [Cryptomeria japonica]